MLVCSLVLARRGAVVAGDLTEVVLASDQLGTGNIIATTLIDAPASVIDRVDAYFGQIMAEKATAIDNVSVGTAHTVLVDEAAAANADVAIAVSQVYSVAVAEGLTATSTQDATLPAVATTWNPSDKVNVTLSGGNLIATGAGNGGVRGTNSHSSTKYYWEYTATTINTNNLNLGIALATTNISTFNGVGAAVTTRASGAINVNAVSTGSTLGIINVGAVIGIAVDFTAKLIWFRKAPSGTWNGSGTADPATGVGGISISSISSGALFPLMANGVSDKITANFGATAFTGAVPSGFTSGF